MEPFRTYKVIKHLIEETGLEIEMHTHNDFGMAVGQRDRRHPRRARRG